MSILLGVGMLFAAFLMIVVFRHLLNRPNADWDPDAFGVSQGIALGFTGLVAFGAIFIFSTAAHGPYPAMLIELVISLAGLIAACFVAGAALKRLFAPGRSTLATAAGLPHQGISATRPDRTPPTPRPASPAGARKRRAA
jgi:hypothetical protein